MVCWYQNRSMIKKHWNRERKEDHSIVDSTECLSMFWPGMGTMRRTCLTIPRAQKQRPGRNAWRIWFHFCFLFCFDESGTVFFHTFFLVWNGLLTFRAVSSWRSASLKRPQMPGAQRGPCCRNLNQPMNQCIHENLKAQQALDGMSLDKKHTSLGSEDVTKRQDLGTPETAGVDQTPPLPIDASKGCWNWQLVFWHI